MLEPPGLQTREAPGEAPGAIVPAKTHLSSSVVVPQAATDVKDKDKIQHTNTQIHMRVIACTVLAKTHSSCWKQAATAVGKYKYTYTRTQINKHEYKNTNTRTPTIDKDRNKAQREVPTFPT